MFLREYWLTPLQDEEEKYKFNEAGLLNGTNGTNGNH